RGAASFVYPGGVRRSRCRLVCVPRRGLEIEVSSRSCTQEGFGNRGVASLGAPLRGSGVDAVSCRRPGRGWSEVTSDRRSPAGLSDFLCMTQSQDSDGQASLEVERQLVHGLAPTMWRPRPLLFGGYDPDVQHLVGWLVVR